MKFESRNRWLAVVYATTIFTSAFLLFQIQPMVSKRILPWFGGTPAVWTTCLLFFQAVLFAGYSYAHFINGWLRSKYQAAAHVAILIVALVLVLQILPSDRWAPTGEADPTLAILTILIVSVGLPYFVLSATGPLLQAWFARSFPGRTPYRLYALSNLGSLLALVSYPFLFERLFDLPAQATIWSTGFVLFGVLCGYAAWRVGTTEPAEGAVVESAQTKNDEANISRPGTQAYLLWLLLPACASVVLMATTNHVSTDIAVVPFLWVVPLALYLVTFIIAFDRPDWYWPTIFAAFTLIAIYVAGVIEKTGVGEIKLYECGTTGRSVATAAELYWNAFRPGAAAPLSPEFRVGFRTTLVANFSAMFGICLLCHGQLARLRPHPRYLTAYYLMIAAGGALGGATVSIVAPHVFKSIVEWKIAMLAGAVSAVGLILYAVVARAVSFDVDRDQPVGPPLAYWILLVVLLAPVSFVLLDLIEYLHAPKANVVFQARNFFGALTIRHKDPENRIKGQYVLLNGTTIHGSQFASPDRRGQPTSYYATISGIGRVLNFFHARRPPGGVRIGDVGLGAGTLAAYALKFDHICFYEINPTVIDMTNSGQWFTYVVDCKDRGAHCDIKLGDARLTLEREVASGSPPRSAEELGEGLPPYHVLVLDAFSSDSVPTHLLTAEAMEIYLPRLATAAKNEIDGALVIHISNRYLDLSRVVRGLAERYEIPCVEVHNDGVPEQAINSADWVILTRNQELLAALAPYAYKPKKTPKPSVLWTDAHSSLFEIIR
jgi:hypothetical protein